MKVNHQAKRVDEFGSNIAKDMHTKWRREFQKNNGKNGIREKPLPEGVAKSGESPEKTMRRLKTKGYTGLRIDNGKIVQNINLPASRIVPELNMKLNGGPATDYAKLLADKKMSFSKGKDTAEVNSALNNIHKIWMKHNNWQKADNPDLFKVFKDLTPEEKIKDLDVLEQALKARRPPPSLGTILFAGKFIS